METKGSKRPTTIARFININDGKEYVSMYDLRSFLRKILIVNRNNINNYINIIKKK